MLLPVNPDDLSPFFWRVPAHTTRKANAAQTLFALAPDAGDDSALRNTVSKAIGRGSAPTAKVTDRIINHVARISALPRSETDRIREIVDADSKAIASEPLPSTKWPIYLNAWRKGIGISGPTSSELISFFAQVNDYADRSERILRALLAGNIDAIRHEVGDLPFGETRTLRFIQRRLAGLNDAKVAGHVLGLLFPLAIVDLVARFASHYEGNTFRFLPRPSDSPEEPEKIQPPMRLFMETVKDLLELSTSERTFMALLQDDVAPDEFDRCDLVGTTLNAKGWSYRALSRASREVPSKDEFRRMIGRAKGHFPEKSVELEMLANDFWQICLFENLLALCEELRDRVHDIDPLLPFADAEHLRSLHEVTAAQKGPQSD